MLPNNYSEFRWAKQLVWLFDMTRKYCSNYNEWLKHNRFKNLKWNALFWEVFWMEWMDEWQVNLNVDLIKLMRPGKMLFTASNHLLKFAHPFRRFSMFEIFYAQSFLKKIYCLFIALKCWFNQFSFCHSSIFFKCNEE